MLIINSSFTHFFLLGFPGLTSTYYGVVSALLLAVFLAITVGNIFTLVLIKLDRNLHKPTYLIFCHLALTDLFFGTVTLPRIIWRYWRNEFLVAFPACFTQMYFVHFLGATHSFILMLMALDRFVAICDPLHYPTVVTNTGVTLLCAISWLMPASWMVAVVTQAVVMPYCNSNVIRQCYCDHFSITRLSCVQSQVLVLAFPLAMFSLLCPLSFIIFSYFAIIVTVAKKYGGESRGKALSTCSPQLLITGLYYMPRCFVYMANNQGYHFTESVRVVVIMIYSLLPAAVNPLIYCFKMKEIKENLKRKFQNRIRTRTAPK
ncbi:olfactory receptor 52E8-like [Corythoichthys intestinalis]|uniref:olfactory receptor 52E8-like n=1 Tax=Corythoichthys intestinalis TaxID=161448 RepID=UPI0025A68412|nr:olfactory receptor 52E8-like [Corythoichthys intestinalis]XP_061807377.1 olfactory receptor 52E8-like [Nerophis lumbriciformis]